MVFHDVDRTARTSRKRADRDFCVGILVFLSLLTLTAVASFGVAQSLAWKICAIERSSHLCRRLNPVAVSGLSGYLYPAGLDEGIVRDE